MGAAIAGTIPLGLGIALKPFVIVASIFILRTANARVNGVAFLLGWIVGLGSLVVLSAQLAQIEVAALHGWVSDLPSLILIALGALVFAAAVRAWRGRPRAGVDPGPSFWHRLIARAGVGHKFGAGIALAAVSLRNVALLAAASAVIGQAGLSLLELALTVAIFVTVSSLGIVIPMLVHAFGGEEADARLESWSRWLNRHVGTVTAIVLAAVGMYLLGRGMVSVF